MLEQDMARTAYETHLPAAQALPPDQVLPYRLDPDVAMINARRGLEAIEPVRARIHAHLPDIDMAVLDALPGLALAVKTAAIDVHNAADDEPSVSEMITQGWKLRGTLLPVVAGLASTGLIPTDAYANIARGRGVRDMADDCVALAAIFDTYEAQVAGKHPADPADIERAERVGTYLLQNLSKRTAQQPSRRPDTVHIRDRMASLLVHRYSDLRAVAYYFYRDDFGDHVPPLMSRIKARAQAEDSEDPTVPEPEPAV